MKTIQDDIKNNSFKHIYLLYGEEGYLVNQFKKKLITALTGDNSFNLTVVAEKPDWEELWSVAETMPFMAEYRVIVFDRCNLFKNKDERAVSFFDRELPDHLIVIIAEESADKRLTLFNLVKKKGYVCELGVQSQANVIKFITGRCADEGKSIGRDAAAEIYIFLAVLIACHTIAAAFKNYGKAAVGVHHMRIEFFNSIRHLKHLAL